MMTDNPTIKVITFADYDKFFRDALALPDTTHILFYRRTADAFTISFSWDGFTIITRITLDRILEMYANDFADTIETSTDDTGEHPAIIKFKAEYLERAIPEVD